MHTFWDTFRNFFFVSVALVDAAIRVARANKGIYMDMND